VRKEKEKKGERTCDRIPSSHPLHCLCQPKEDGKRGGREVREGESPYRLYREGKKKRISANGESLHPNVKKNSGARKGKKREKKVETFSIVSGRDTEERGRL